MSELRTRDGRYLFADQGDGNAVVYDGTRAVWDRWSYEASSSEPVGDGLQPALLPPLTPAGVRVIRVTTDQDGPFAPRMMSDRANAWVSGRYAFVFAGSRTTGGPLFFRVDLLTLEVQPLGPLLPYVGETEGWLWLPDGRLVALDGPRLLVVNPFTGSGEVVIDISRLDAGWDLWQPHASDEGQTFSATVRQIVNDGPYPKIGTVTLHHGDLRYWPAVGVLDESQCSRRGKEVVIKENRGAGDDNRIINLDTREQRWIADRERALGHSDCGPDFIVGEADKPDPGACVLRYLDRLDEEPRILFLTTNLGYVSCRGGRVLLSDHTHLSLVPLDGSGLIPLVAHGGGVAYDDRVKANLSPCGRVACYMVRGSVYLAVLE